MHDQGAALSVSARLGPVAGPHGSGTFLSIPLKLPIQYEGAAGSNGGSQAQLTQMHVSEGIQTNRNC